MAKKQVQTSDLVQDNIFSKFKKEAKEVLDILDNLNKGLKSTAKSFENVAKSTEQTQSKSINDLMKAYEGINEAQKESVNINKTRNKVISEQEKLEEKLAKALSDEGKEIARLKAEIQKANKSNVESLKITEKLKDLESGRGVETAKTALRVQELNKRNKEAAKIALGLTDAYDELTKETNKAQRNLKKLAAQFGVNSKQAKKAKKEFDRLDDQLREINEAAKDGRRDVGRYGIAIEGLSDKLGGLVDKADDTGGALGELAQGLKSGGLVGGAVALGSAAIGAFTSTEDGALKAETALASLKGGFNAVTGSVGGFVGALFDGKGVSEAYNENLDGLVDKTQKAAKSQKDAVIQQNELRTSLRDTGTRIAQLSAEFAVLSVRAGDATITLEAQRQATIDTQQKAVEIAEEELRIISEEISITNKLIEARKGLDNRELLDQLAEQQKELIEREGELNTEIETLAKERRQILQDEWEQRLDFLFDASDRQKSIAERQLQDERITIEERKQLLEDLADNLKSTYERIEKEFSDAAGQQIDLAKFANLEAEAQADLLKTLNLSEIERNRLREGVVEYLAVQQDLTDANKDLAESEREILDARGRVEAQQKLLQEIKEGNIVAITAEEDYQDELTQLQIKSLTERIENQKKANQETVNEQEELNELLLDIEFKRIEKEEEARLKQEKEQEEKRKNQLAKDKKLAEEQAKALDAIYGSIANGINKRIDKNIANIENRISKVEERRTQLEEAAAQGSKDAIDSLVLEAKEQEKLELQAEKRRRQQIQIEAGLAAIRIAGQKAAEGKSVSEALNDVGVIQSITSAIVAGVPAFFEGTEDTGKVNKALDSNGGRVAILHDNERVMTKAQNTKIGDISNEELANVGALYNQGKLISVSEMNQKRPIKMLEKPSFDMGLQFKELIKEVKELPKKMPTNSLYYDQREKAMYDIVDTRFNRHVKKSKIKGGIFS